LVASGPKYTSLVVVKFEPWITTASPPELLPAFGDTAVIAGSGSFEKLNADAAVSPPGFCTVSTYGPPGTPGSVMTVTRVASFTTTFDCVTPSMLTVNPDTKSAPRRITLVPPLAVPACGKTLVIAGIGPNCSAPASLP